MKEKSLKIAATGGHSLLMRKFFSVLPSLRWIEKVIVFDIQPPVVDDDRVEFYELDLTLPESRGEMAHVMQENSIDLLIHSAFLWNPVRDRTWGHELEAVGTEFVLAASLEAGVKKVIVTSSTLLYGAKYNNEIGITEDYPLNAKNYPTLKDKVKADNTAVEFAKKHPEIVVTVLRSAVVLGPTVHSFIGRLLKQNPVTVVMGYDPMVQLLHEDDFLKAYLIVIQNDFQGVFNIVPSQPLHLSKVIKLGNRTPMPIPHFLLKPMYQVMYSSDLTDFHPSLVDFLRFPIIADGEKASKEMGFKADYTTADTARAFYNSRD